MPSGQASDGDAASELFPQLGNYEPSLSASSEASESTSSDLHSSIIHKIIRAGSIPAATSSRFYYSDLYDYYANNDSHEYASDFEAYERRIQKENRIRNAISRLSEERRSRQSWSQPKLGIVNLSRVSSLETVPIDECEEVEELPIELQAIGHSRKSDCSDINIDDDQPEMIVSNDENLDYTFRRIEPTIKPRKKKKSFFDYFNINRNYRIQRKLHVRHLHQIALGGTLGVGLLLSSGKSFSIAGPLGCLLGFSIAGLIVLATMLSFCEMVTLIPLCGGVSGVSSRFVDDAFGFALGVCYWLSYCIGFPTEITAASIMLSFYPNLDIPGPNTAGWITLFLVVALLINLCDIRVYGEIEYFSTLFKLLILVALLIYNCVLNAGGSAPHHERIGFRYWDSSKSDLEHHITYGPFRPTFDVKDTGTGATGGIGGAKGRFLQVLVASVVASYGYVGTEIVLIAGGESRNPRHAIPLATRNIYWRILVFYILSVFIIGLNIYSGDPRLLRYFTWTGPSTQSEKKQREQLEAMVIQLNGGGNCKTHLLQWAGFANGNQSPFVIALQSAGLCTFAAATNGFLVYFALTAASSQLYASSRTLYYLSIQGKAPKLFSICSRNGVPYLSVLFTGLFSCLAYLSVDNNTALVFERLLSVCASTGLLVWSGMCLSFIRFYYGLQLRPDIISRTDKNYPYRSPFQPYLAYFGMLGSLCLVLIGGFVAFIHGQWSPAYFISCYGSLFVCIFCYIMYKIFRRTRIHRLDQLDLDSGRREIDRIIWEDDTHYASNFREIISKGISLLL
ncbi:hypothetical protein KL918_000460 [Ogataea parapolymorpha]|uniref:Component of the SPS plasma membrane amino acid sensor system (Ssy1p-Ptr3p-Ssy5p) n=1 Tax=Ogataea parapolymorpha (strain ATCC 26012 / BCRC 20466 / JCM 22074 / NRRL Y-7560 / DL-1) TaxID=871575 RepID=W1Q909_OGAPD|nr:Component of the SPS plasma membrane amino acid sensor system (Ssy1p-Ptr3p-Ssy5p) [Ogataea parapolymorpha DL-1]ESW96506.1 Component of the SPS plasma membrane amino acid sensor system (Ssy1p-Ptr3p-Ssy5p) [Ogataea parapolymorpha DL-1]KAG7870256.1 hypothetical protein KL918_000460 [Ogataea parapolymorpha]KAG7875205.1 hypothetical protein KL916_000817 [Ogataea parapolymorpha]